MSNQASVGRAAPPTDVDSKATGPVMTVEGQEQPTETQPPSRAGWLEWAGSRAMKPQVATGAVLVLLLAGSYLLFGVGASGGATGTPTITEKGVPETSACANSQGRLGLPRRLPPLDKHLVRGTAEGVPDGHSNLLEVSHTPSSAPRSPSSSSPDGTAQKLDSDSVPGDAHFQAFSAALGLYKAGQYVASRRAFDEIVLQGGNLAPRAALYSAMSVRASSGCDKALPFLEGVVARFGPSPEGKQAKWETALCARVLGDYVRARILFRELSDDPSYRDRAESELKRISRTPPPRHNPGRQMPR